MQKPNTHTVLVVGGGFGGAKLARTLGNMRLKNLRIVLVDPKSYMEYHAAFYRMVTGRSTMESCLPYADILQGSSVQIVRDSADHVSLDRREVIGKSGATYSYDSLVLCVGAETSFFGVQGVAERSQKMKTADDAIRLKQHIHSLFEEVKTAPKELKLPLMHLVIIGGGATGVELAGELASYSKVLAAKHGVDQSLITIDLVEAMPRLLASLPEELSLRVQKHLKDLGVNVLLNRAVQSEDDEFLRLSDMNIRTKTVVWTAGTKGHPLFASIKGLSLDKKGRVIVKQDLSCEGFPEVFVLGDSAATKFSGMAQTALSDGAFVANVIASRLQSASAPVYTAKEPIYAIPVGPKWAAVSVRNHLFYGRVGWMIRRLLDLKVFTSLLSVRLALGAFASGTQRTESCHICECR